MDKNLLLAYHDRSDGGLFVTLTEMALAGRVGATVDLDGCGDDPRRILFSEELGAVVQVADVSRSAVEAILKRHGLDEIGHVLGRPGDSQRAGGVPRLDISLGGRPVVSERVSVLNRRWSELTYRLQARRDHPECAAEEYDALLDETDVGMRFELSYDPTARPSIRGDLRPRMAILREQGINGQSEMAAAFDRAGFECVDVHMTDLLGGRVHLRDFAGLVACGGFSYGDVLGAGAGWARSVLYNAALKDMFAAFFARPDTFALGICNGCQMISQLKDIIPGADHWPVFTRNRSEQFEARFVTVEVLESPSILLRGMAGSRIGIPVAHGEGFADFAKTGSLEAARQEGLVSLRYVDHQGAPTVRYPLNPNGSPDGVTGLTTRDGRVTIMMPHPERAFRSVQLSWCPESLKGADDGPWMRLFYNARAFVEHGR